MEILDFLTSVWHLNEDSIIDDKQLLAIYEAISWEEYELYDNIIQLFLENEYIPENDLKQAVSYMSMKLYLIEQWLLWIEKNG